jgi:HEPN domain-containing protein
MKRLTSQWVRKAESDYVVAKKLARGSDPHHDEVCFHAQQAAEKFLKALLEELSQPVPRTHVLEDLILSLAVHHPGLRSLRIGARFLSRFAVATRYPGKNARKREATSGPPLEWARQRSGGALTYHPEPVDATKVPGELTGLRTMFQAFHHLRPDQARAALADAAAKGQGVAIFDGTRPGWWVWPLLLFTPLRVLLATPFILTLHPEIASSLVAGQNRRPRRPIDRIPRCSVNSVADSRSKRPEVAAPCRHRLATP